LPQLSDADMCANIQFALLFAQADFQKKYSVSRCIKKVTAGMRTSNQITFYKCRIWWAWLRLLVCGQSECHCANICARRTSWWHQSGRCNGWFINSWLCSMQFLLGISILFPCGSKSNHMLDHVGSPQSFVNLRTITTCSTCTVICPCYVVTMSDYKVHYGILL
jgi:hypothetical protein